MADIFTTASIEDFDDELIGQIKELIEEIRDVINGDKSKINFVPHFRAAKDLLWYLEKNLSVHLIQNFEGEDYPKAFSNDVLMQNAVKDFLMIRRSFTEENSDELRSKKNAIGVRQLIKAIALNAYKPAADPFFKGIVPTEKPAAITYQTTRFEIRIVPYSPVIFIGYPATMPFDARKFKKDPTTYQLDHHFIAIAHEIGHKVFNHGYIDMGKGKQVPIEGYLRTMVKAKLGALQCSVDEIDWANSKLEEMFSDAYGCLIDGPVSVLGFQKQMGLSRPAVGMELGHRYLNAPMRPLVQTRMMKGLPKAKKDVWVDQAVAVLDKRWKEWVLKNWTKWLGAQWPDLTAAGEIQDLDEKKLDLIAGARYSFGEKNVVGYRLFEILDTVVAEIIGVLKEAKPDWNDVTLDDQKPIEASLLEAFTQAAKDQHAVYLKERDPKTVLEEMETVLPGSETKLVLQTILAGLPEFAKQFSDDPEAFVDQHDAGELDDDVIEEVKRWIVKQTIDGEHIDEIVMRQLLRGWSDEGPIGNGRGGY